MNDQLRYQLVNCFFIAFNCHSNAIYEGCSARSLNDYNTPTRSSLGSTVDVTRRQSRTKVTRNTKYSYRVTFARGCSFPNRVYGFSILKKFLGFFQIFWDFLYFRSFLDFFRFFDFFRIIRIFLYFSNFFGFFDFFHIFRFFQIFRIFSDFSIFFGFFEFFQIFRFFSDFSIFFRFSEFFQIFRIFSDFSNFFRFFSGFFGCTWIFLSEQPLV